MAPKNTPQIRPFEVYIPQEEGFGVVTITGRIEERRLVISAIGCQVQLEAIEVGEDYRGAFIVVEECDRELTSPFRLRLEVEGQDTILSVFIPAKGTTGNTHWSERCFRVYFNSWGYKDGQGSTLRGEQRAPAVN